MSLTYLQFTYPHDADITAAIDEVENFVVLCNINQLDSAIIIVGDFNKAKLSNGMTQYVNFNTRERRKLDLCYSNIKDAYAFAYGLGF